MSNNFWKRKRTQEEQDADPFVGVKVFIPRSTFKILDDIRAERLTPISRLIAYAIDNELDSKIPFNYPVELPTTEFIEYQYADEAGRMCDFMQRFPAGISLDSLMLLRRDMKIDSRSALLYAYRELLEVGMVEEIRARSNNYGPKHMLSRLVGLTKKVIVKKKYKRIEGERTTQIITDDDVEREDD